MTSLIPKKMFRARDGKRNMGMFFVLAHKLGPDGKIVWHPDSKDVTSVDEWVEKIDDWEKAKLSRLIMRTREIAVSEGTESINVVCASMSASPVFKTKCHE